MPTFSRATLLGMILFISARAEVPGQTRASARGSTISQPTGSAVLRESAAAMQRSLHAVHTNGRIQMYMVHRAARQRVTGDCVMMPRYWAFQFWRRGTTFVNGTFQAIDSHYIAIQRHTWVRSPATHHTWQRANADQGALQGLDLCPVLFMSQPGVATLVPSAQNLGAVATGAWKTWHIRIRGPSLVMDFYVDQRSHNWVRLVSDGRGPPRQHEAFDYSRFNETVTIKPPKLGTSNPYSSRHG